MVYIKIWVILIMSRFYLLNVAWIIVIDCNYLLFGLYGAVSSVMFNIIKFEVFYAAQYFFQFVINQWIHVNLRACQMVELDVRRTEVLGNSEKNIQCKVRSYTARKLFLALRNAAIDFQALWRSISCSCICRSASSKCLCILSTPVVCRNCFFLPC